jgi:hypothetical protein
MALLNEKEIETLLQEYHPDWTLQQREGLTQAILLKFEDALYNIVRRGSLDD